MSESKQPEKRPAKPLTGQQKQNLVSDTVMGPNLRLKDNLFQGLAILVCLILGGLIGYLVVKEQPMGVLLGGGIGLLVGLFGSGIYLMIYRAVKHSRGEHD